MTEMRLLRKIAVTIMSETLRTAVERGDAAMVALKVEAGDDVSDAIAFQTACALGHTEIVRLLLLLDRGVNPAAENNAALRYACLHGRTKIVRLLLDLQLDRGVNPSANHADGNAFELACGLGHTEICSYAPGTAVGPWG
jgi:ankyrin repeat protein